jgi:hypothetical protein
LVVLQCGAQETLVRGVLQEAADEVGHAGQQGADGAVLADAMALLEEGDFNSSAMP